MADDARELGRHELAGAASKRSDLDERSPPSEGSNERARALAIGPFSTPEAAAGSDAIGAMSRRRRALPIVRHSAGNVPRSDAESTRVNGQ